MTKLPTLVQNHARRFRDRQYVYPVVSRRSGGLSLGVNLSPSARCNFACVYCQVLGELNIKLLAAQSVLAEGDRLQNDPQNAQSNSMSAPMMGQMESEIRQLAQMIVDGTLFDDDWFAKVPPDKRVLRDIAFSGDGEPTLSPHFSAAVGIAAKIRRELALDATKIVLITNATTLHLDTIRCSLRTMLANNGEIWAKLDAGTTEYFAQIARTTVPFEKILANIRSAAQEFPLILQTCCLALHGHGPSSDEIRAYADRIVNILSAGGQISRIQLYTTARITPERWVSPLSDEQLAEIGVTLREITGLQIDIYGECG